MPLLVKARSLLRNLFLPRRVDVDLDQEVHSHLEMLTEENIRAGMPPKEAERAARIELGGMEQVKEQVREEQIGNWLHSVISDCRYGVRQLRKNPGFTAVAVLTLALGIGANTAIFSVVNAVLVRPLPYKDASQLVILQETDPRVGDVSVTYPDFLDWRHQSHTLAQMAAFHNKGFNLSGVEQPERIVGYGVSPNFLSMLGVRPVLGRDLLLAEEKQGTDPVVLLSYKLWQSHFGADPQVLGRSIMLDSQSFTIVGILPPAFGFLGRSDIIAPIGVWADKFMDRGNHGDLGVLGRLAPGATVAQASTEMGVIASGLAQQYPDTNRDEGVNLYTLRDIFVGDTRPAILVVFGAVTFVLLIACLNVTNLFLVRSTVRAKEISVRLALGAGRGRIIRQLLTESFLLALLGGGLGIVVGVWGITGISHLLPTDSFQSMGVQMDLGVLTFTAVIIMLVAVAFGLGPALQASRQDVQETLKEGGRGSTSGAAQHRLRCLLATTETSLALVLLVGAGLMLNSLYHLLRVSPGFQPDRVLTMEMDLRSTQYSKPAAVINFWQQVLDRVHTIPGVETVAVGTNIPLTNDHNRSDITIDGLPSPPSGDSPHPDWHVISSGYTTVLGVPLLRGRLFTDADNETSPPVALINARMAQRFWSNGDPIGHRFTWGHPENNKETKWITIVGVLGDTKLYGLGNPSRLEVYLPFGQKLANDMNLVVRSAADPALLTSAIQESVAAVDKDQPIFGITTMKEVVDNSESTRRVTLVLLALFSALALVLAAIGVYGVIAYSVQRRTQEVGIRVAFGAQKIDILRLVLKEGIRLTLLGVAIGIVAALGLTRLMSALLFGVSPTDPLTFLGVAALLTLVSLAACYIPARRATRVDPMIALRYE
jgi:putative ABC transport system permease protein